MNKHQIKIERAIIKLNKVVKNKYLRFTIDAHNIMLKAVRAVIIESKFNTGKLYRSIRKRPLWKSGNILKAQIISDKRIAPYGGVINAGRKPGSFPNIINLKRYLVSKGESIETLDQAAFLVGRKIARDGIRAFPYMKKGRDTALPKIKSLAIKYGMKFR